MGSNHPAKMSYDYSKGRLTRRRLFSKPVLRATHIPFLYTKRCNYEGLSSLLGKQAWDFGLSLSDIA